MMDQSLVLLLWVQTVQVTVVALFVWALVRCFAKNRPHLAHSLWLLVLLKCITPPIWSSPTGAFSWMAYGMNSTANVSAEDVSLEHPVHPNGQHRQLSNLVFAERSNVDETAVLPVPCYQSSAQERFVLDPGNDKSKSSWMALLGWAWIVSAVFVLLIAMVRLYQFNLWLGRTSKVHFPLVERMAIDLSRRLGVRSKVRVLVVDGSVGPAVIGLLSPKIVLPRSIAEKQSRESLESLLAHELVHFRRGDLWWSALQTLATSLFWFHPLVWFASRMVSRESERSCDEETVACLGCRPADYARSLLSVLETKQFLRVAPAVPGIRQVDVTSARLERVMRFGNGIQKKTPTWVWFVMMAVGLIVLPGAAVALTPALQDSEGANQEKSWERLPARNVLPLAKKTETSPKDLGAAFGIPLLSDIPYVGRLFKNVGAIEGQDSIKLEMNRGIGYDISDVIAQFERLGVEQDLEGFLKDKLAYPQPVYSTQSNGDGTWESNLSGYEELDVRFDIKEGRMFVGANKVVHERIAKDIKHFAKFGFEVVCLETRFLNVSRKTWAELGISWEIAAAQNGRATFEQGVKPLGRQVGDVQFGAPALIQGVSEFESPVRSASFVTENVPTLYSIVDDKKVYELIKQLKRDSVATLTQAPTVSCYNGNEANIVDGCFRPFVTSLKKVVGDQAVAFQPVISIISDGITVKQVPVLSEDRKHVKLDLNLEISEIKDVKQFSIPNSKADRQSGLTIQVPVVEVTSVESTMSVPDGQTLAVSLLQADDKTDTESKMLVVLVTCRVLAPEAIDDSKPASPTATVPITVNTGARKKTARQKEVALGVNVNSNSNPDKFERLRAALKPYNMFESIDGKIEYQIDDERILIRGEPISVSLGDTRMKGDKGEIVIKGSKENRTVLFQMEGNVEAEFDDAFEIAADQFEFGGNEESLSLKLDGNGRLWASGFELKADQIISNLVDGKIELKGNGSIVQHIENGPKTLASGPQIFFDLSTAFGSAVKQDANVAPSAYYLDEDIQYFPQGPEYKLSREAAALTRARAAKRNKDLKAKRAAARAADIEAEANAKDHGGN